MCHPDDLPEGYHTAARGQSVTRPGGGGVEGCPRAPVRSGCARSTGWHSAGGERAADPGCDQMCDQDATEAPGSGRYG